MKLALTSGRRNEATGDSKQSQRDFSEQTASKGAPPQHRLQDPYGQQEFAGLRAYLFQTCLLALLGAECSQ